MLDSNVNTLLFIAGGVSNPDELSAVELNAAADNGNLTCAIRAGYTLAMSNSDNFKDAGLCDEGNVDGWGYANYSGEWEFYFPALNAPPDSPEAKAKAFFTNWDRETTVDVVRRIGKKSTDPFQTGDEVDLFRFKLDFPQLSAPGDGQKNVSFKVVGAQQGLFRLGAPVTA
jgi:hypothetical protein